MQGNDYLTLARQEFAAAAPVAVAFVVLAGIDIVTGILKGLVRKEISSSASRVGMAKKTAVLLVIATCSVMDPFVPNVNLCYLVALAFCVTESLSIIENAGRIGVKIPNWLKRVFVRLQDDNEPKEPRIGMLEAEKRRKGDSE